MLAPEQGVGWSYRTAVVCDVRLAGCNPQSREQQLTILRPPPRQHPRHDERRDAAELLDAIEQSLGYHAQPGDQPRTMPSCRRRMVVTRCETWSGDKGRRRQTFKPATEGRERSVVPPAWRCSG